MTDQQVRSRQHTIERVAVIGAGTMGSGIAQVIALSGLSVVVIDIDRSQLEQAEAAISRGLQRLVDKGCLTTEQRGRTMASVSYTTDVAGAAGVDLAIEAIVERLAPKQAVLGQLATIVGPDAILASNTSSISIAAIGEALRQPERFLGIHFMNPAPVMQLVEVIRGPRTSGSVTESALGFVRSLDNKTPVLVQDSPGFVLNRVLIPMINEAACVLHEGIASAQDIDTAMKLGANHPMGPLALADLIGIDTCLAIMQVLHSDLHDAKYKPCPLLADMVANGRLGRKSGQGFYTYEPR